MDYTPIPIACPSCAQPLSLKYCAACGEEKVDSHSWSLSHFFHDAFHEFAHLDSKIFGTFWNLLRRPGLLTADYWLGRRRVWIRPLRLFIVVAAIHLIAVSSSQLRIESLLPFDFTGALHRTIAKLAALQHVPVPQVTAIVNERMGKIFALTQYLSVALFALAPWLLYSRQRPWYTQHLIFSLHTYTFYFLLTSLTFQLFPVISLARAPLALLTVAYIYFSLRRLYGESIWKAAGKAFMLRFAHIAAEAVAMGIAVSASFFWTAYSIRH
jgi:hypothetical protein